jgi:hypothetical protein
MVTYSGLFEFTMLLVAFANLSISIAGIILQIEQAKRNDRQTRQSLRSFRKKN